MQVLFLTQVLPYPPDSGPKVKSFNVLKYLARHYEVTLVSFVRGDQSVEVRRLGQICRTVHTVPMARSLLFGQPWMMLRDERIAMRRLVDRLAAEHKFDVVHADQLNMAQYAQRLRSSRKVLDAHNALWLLYRRLWETLPPGPERALLGRDWKLLKSYEGRMCREFDAVIAVSDEDKTALEEAMGMSRDIAVIPIAIDGEETPMVNRALEANHIVHLGTMYWPPNIDGIMWFVREIFPTIRGERPDVALDVIGARPPRELRRLHGCSMGVNVTGYVKDVQPYLEQAGVFIVPLRAGGGMRVKILEALARGLPVVTTSLGCEGIKVKHERHALIADSPEAFAQAALRLLEDHAFADELGRNGRRLIESAYDYRTACKPLDEVYRAQR